jgi:phosphoglycolate phosphatase
MDSFSEKQTERRAVIFDFDYTLADPSQGMAESINFALNGLGLPAASPEQINQTIGLSLADTLLHLAGPEYTARYDEFLHLFVRRADEIMSDRTVLFEAVPSLIGRLSQQGFGLGIVSMKYREHIEPVLRRENLAHYFEVIIGGRDVVRPKPDPEGVQTVLARLNSSSVTAIYVGDSVSDAETARRAGIPFIAVLAGYTERDAFNRYEVYRFCGDISELIW